MVITQEQVHASRARLLSVLLGLTDEELNWKPNENSWTIAQVVQHISMIEGRSLTIVSMGLAEESEFTPRELNLDEAIPNRTTKVNAPPQFHPGDDPKTLAELKEILENSHQAYIDCLNRVKDDDRLDTTSPPMPHPVFGKMSTRQWIEAAYYHKERHVRQIEEIKGLLKTR